MSYIIENTKFYMFYPKNIAPIIDLSVIADSDMFYSLVINDNDVCRLSYWIVMSFIICLFYEVCSDNERIRLGLSAK